MKLVCMALRRTVLLVVVSLCILGFGLTASAAVENLARGGDFEDEEDMAEWTLDIADGSLGEMSIDDTTAAVGESSLFFSSDQLSGNDGTRPRFNQFGHLLTKGKTYTFAAFFKAEEERGASMTVQLNGAPWTRFVEKTIVIGTEWEEKWAVFTVPIDAEVSLQPTRNTGSTVNYWVDGVRFFEGEYEPYDFGQKAVSSVGKLAAKWGAVRSLY
ncbi:carbohydrate binding domain-containing protein [Candidatus Poribacteria bacterium]